MPSITTGPLDPSTPAGQRQLIAMQFSAMAEIVDQALSRLGVADSDDRYAVLTEKDAYELRDMLRGIANLFKGAVQ